jgi:hypothetical protein
MSSRTPRHPGPGSAERPAGVHPPAPATRRRRVAAVRARRRRLLRIDIAFALLLALATVVLAPGLAMVALIALIALALCGVSLAVERLRARGALRRAARDGAAGVGPARRQGELP